jgi:chromosome partitioning protein
VVTVTVLNLKGGVGKTSTCHHVGGTLARMGYRVLLLDNDPQASLTQGLLGPAAVDALSAWESVASLYDPDTAPVPAALVRPSGIENLWLVPGSPLATPFNVLPADRWPELETGIRSFLGRASDDFDVCLVDNPPNLHLCSRSSLVASDGLVVPLQAEDYGAQGLRPVMAALESAREVNPTLRLLGLLVTMFDSRLGIHQTYDALLRESYGSSVFGSRIPLAKDFKEAVASRVPISHYKPKGAPAKAARAVADELVARADLLGREGVAA